MVSTCFNTDFLNKTKPLRVVRRFRGTHRISFSHIPVTSCDFRVPGHGDAGSAMGQVDEERLKRQDAEDSRTKLTSEMEALRVEEPWDPWDPWDFDGIFMGFLWDPWDPSKSSWSSKSRKGRYVWKKYQHGKYVWISFHVLSSSGWFYYIYIYILYIYILYIYIYSSIREWQGHQIIFYHVILPLSMEHFYPMCSMTGATAGGSDIGTRRFTASARQLRAGQVKQNDGPRRCLRSLTGLLYNWYSITLFLFLFNFFNYIHISYNNYTYAWN